MTIMFLVRSLDYGGAERQLVVLAKGLQSRGHDVIVALFYGGWAAEQELLAGGVRVVHLDKGGRWDIVRFAKRLLHTVWEEQPVVIHGYHGTPNLMTLLPKLFCSGVKIVWGIRCSNMDWRRYEWVVTPLAWVTAWLSQFADAHIANSQAGLSCHVAMGYPAKKMVYIPNGVDTERFRPDRVLGNRVRTEWGIGAGELLIGLVARLDPMKGHTVFLEAAERLAKIDPKVKFVCVGDGPISYRTELHRDAQRLGLEKYVRWAGARADMPAVQNALDLAVSCSVYGEGVSNAISEAMACGVPCVVSDVGDSAWVVGPIGTIVPPNDPDKLAHAMAGMLTAPRPAASMIRQRILDHLSLDTLVNTTEQALQAVIAGGMIEQAFLGKASVRTVR